MDEGKLASEANPSDAQFDLDAQDAPGLQGRFRNPVAHSLDLGAGLSDDEEAIARMAKRFRGPGGNIFGSSAAPSLDVEPAGGSELSATELQDFLLNVLDAPEPEAPNYQLETFEQSGAPAPVAAPAATPGEASEPRALSRRTNPMVDPRAESPASQAQRCGSCSALNPAGMRFCVQCGGSLRSEAPAVPAAAVVPAPRPAPPGPSAAALQENPWDIRLISINEDGSDGTAIALQFLETTLGSDGDTRFPSDAFLSPSHARLHINNGELFIEDLGSLNGTFLKLSGEIQLKPGDTFLMGRQVLRFERFEQAISPRTKSADGTRYMGSPAPGGSYRVLQIGVGDVVQNVYCLPEAGAVLGREKGDIIFPNDKFMSSRHAQVYAGEDGHCHLVDLNSSNGTWIKLWKRTRLQRGDYIFMGQQLFRVFVS